MDSVNKHRESQEDSGSKPRAARNEMPGEKDSRTLSAPTGLRRCSPCRQATTPSGLAISFPLSPRVARASQPWAGGHNPFGIGNGYLDDLALPTAISYRFQKDNQAPPSMRAIKTFGQPQQYKSGRGQPHSKTCRMFDGSESARSVLECGCPLPLWLEPHEVTDTFNRTTRIFPSPSSRATP